MQTVCLELSKYVLAFLMAFYALAAYRGAVIRNEDKRKKIYRIQNIIMVIVHFTGYLIMYVAYDDMNYIYLYFAQLVYLGAVIMLYMVFYPKASRLLVNNMCMLMAVGFDSKIKLYQMRKAVCYSGCGHIAYTCNSVAVKDSEKLQKNGMDILWHRTCASAGSSSWQ